MIEVVGHHHLPGDAHDAVIHLVGMIEERTGRRPVSDAQWLDLRNGGDHRNDSDDSGDSDGNHILLARDRGQLAGFAQITGDASVHDIAVVVVPETVGVVDVLLAAALDHIRVSGGGEAVWRVFDMGDDSGDHSNLEAAATAHQHGLRPGRRLHQMWVPLPLDNGQPEINLDELSLRSFRVGDDEAAWLVVNNAAFAAHPEQGRWTEEMLRQREREPWFDPAGFLLHHRGDRLAAFCWTKVHAEQVPVLGEIYVIAVHPDFHGMGLGKALTVAGLRSLSLRGIGTGMLYVDHDNTAAFELYRRLGFRIRRTDQAFIGTIGGAPA